jgi:hypothetical protein
MRPLAIVCLITLLTTLLSGCFNTELIAPENHQVRVLTSKEPVTFHTEYKNWYLLGGVLPIYTTQPEEIIAQEQLTEVRVQTEDTISDGVITFFTAVLFIGLFPQTVVVEGNKTSTAKIIPVK